MTNKNKWIVWWRDTDHLTDLRYRIDMKNHLRKGGDKRPLIQATPIEIVMGILIVVGLILLIILR